MSGAPHSNAFTSLVDTRPALIVMPLLSLVTIKAGRAVSARPASASKKIHPFLRFHHVAARAGPWAALPEMWAAAILHSLGNGI